MDIVVGTRTLLAKTIEFKDLGLLIVDEEQHFGVKHKERLKALKADVHVLTLTTTLSPDHATRHERRSGNVDHRDAAGGPAGRSYLCCPSTR